MKYTDLCEQAEKALKGVTDGPWENGIDTVILPPEGPAVALMGIHCPPNTRAANARFIAFTRAWVPAAAAAIRELEAARDKNWSEYLSERDARMASNMREATWQARAEAAEAKVARLEGEVTALEWFSETSAANAIAVKKHLDDLNKSAALTEGTPTEYERKVAQMKEDFPNGI